MFFTNREQAGKDLAKLLIRYKNQNPIILALPRGGVPVGYEISRVLHAPLDVIISRKLTVPGNPEFGIGAIAPEGVCVLDKPTIQALGLTSQQIEASIEKEKLELQRRVHEYRGAEAVPDVLDKTVILVDDGLATGVTARAAILVLQRHQPKQIILAIPVCAPEVITELQNLSVQTICLTQPQNFISVGLWYKEFEQVSDQEVLNLLKSSRQNLAL